jgi:hypothetical protein
MDEQIRFTAWEIRKRKAKEYFSTRTYAPKELIERGAWQALAEIEICNNLNHQKRLWLKINTGGDGCWLWMDHVDIWGYGIITVKNIPVRAHRAVFRLCNGLSPICVIHQCDTPRCCNPAHLIGGNQRVNIRDCVQKNRHPRQKITWDQTLQIRNDSRPSKIVAAEYRITSGRVNEIKRGQIGKPNAKT